MDKCPFSDYSATYQCLSVVSGQAVMGQLLVSAAQDIQPSARSRSSSNCMMLAQKAAQGSLQPRARLTPSLFPLSHSAKSDIFNTLMHGLDDF